MVLDFLAGCAGGIAGVIVGYPLDTIKVHLQTQDVNNPKYRGTWHCFSSILKKESAWGFYKGMTSPLAGVAIVNAILFGVYGNMQRMLPPQWSPYMNVFLAGASAGMVQSVICSPMELAKTRMQLQEDETSSKSKSHIKNNHHSFTDSNSHTTALKSSRLPTMPVTQIYKNPLDCLMKIHHAEGMKGVYRGYGITLTREIPAFGIYFVSYEWFCQLLRGEKSEAEMGAVPILLAGGFSGVCSWVLTYPIDVVKSRVQTDGFLGPKKYKGTIDCFVQSYRTEGFNAFTRGLTSTIIRAFPTNAATFLVVSMTFKIFGPLVERQHDKDGMVTKVVIDIKDKKFEELLLQS